MQERERLQEVGQRCGVPLGEDALERLERFLRALSEAATKMNLTGFDEQRRLENGVAGALALWPLVGEARRIVDIGSGNGFPGVVWASVAQERTFVFIESRQRRGSFLEDVVSHLGLRARVLVDRAENVGRGSLRESFDVGVARAVGSVAYTSELGLPLLRTGGRLILPKGPSQRDEVDQGAPLIEALGGRARVEAEPSPMGNERRGFVCIVDKLASTPRAYPRSGRRLGRVEMGRRG